MTFVLTYSPIDAIFLSSTQTPVSSVVLAVTPRSLHVFTRVDSSLAIYLQQVKMRFHEFKFKKLEFASYFESGQATCCCRMNFYQSIATTPSHKFRFAHGYYKMICLLIYHGIELGSKQRMVCAWQPVYTSQFTLPGNALELLSSATKNSHNQSVWIKHTLDGNEISQRVNVLLSYS